MVEDSARTTVGRELPPAAGAGILVRGAVLRRTSDSGAHAAGSGGGKGGSSSRDAGRMHALSGGVP
jgi:hypothetical protein